MSGTLAGDCQTRPHWRWFAGWSFVGAAYIVGLLGAFTIGLFVLLPAILATSLLVRRPDARRAMAGLIAGFGVGPLIVAYLNRDGPGRICTTLGQGGSSCSQEWSPWPWLIVAVVLLAAGFGAFVNTRRHAGHVTDLTA